MNGKSSDRTILTRLAYHAMTERGLLPDFSPEVLALVKQMPDQPKAPGDILDMRALLWSSIDNDDSRDLDQLSVAQAGDGEEVGILVAIADVDSRVLKDSPVDLHARQNTTSVYTPPIIFPMLPERLSTDLTSLNFHADRLAMVVEMRIGADGALQASSICRAWVRNHAKLAYHSVGAWLEGHGVMPHAIAEVPGLEENLRLQDSAAQRMKAFRHRHGALTLETIEANPVFEGDSVHALEIEQANRANELVENFMIYANGVTARFLSQHGYPSIRRVVLAPKRWDRIVELADTYGVKLPGAPDSIALEEFLVREKAKSPKTFPDVSLAVIKLLGPGEYLAESPGDTMPDHFSLAARDYTHSTAPNRRYTDLITQRLLKAALEKQPSPYRMDELIELAKQCTDQEDEANKVERQMNKSAAALLLQRRIGEKFDALVTGASPKGTWVRLLSIPVEGRLISGFQGVDVGDRLRVQLSSVSVEQGFIDFRRTFQKRR